jgi:hypothetical protein
MRWWFLFCLSVMLLSILAAPTVTLAQPPQPPDRPPFDAGKINIPNIRTEAPRPPPRAGMADAIFWCVSHPRVVMLVLFLIIVILGTMRTERGHRYTREDRSYRAFVVRGRLEIC